ncbi:MAG: hypothetical protein ABI837_10480, partial [Acidobacteriota bacterium]
FPALAAAPRVEHTPLACVGPASHARISAHIPGNPAGVRVYFHVAGATCGEYYVDMRRSASDPTLYTAFLPILAAGAQVLTYEIRTTDGVGKEIAGMPISVALKNDCPAPALTADEVRAAENITLGLTNAAQSQAPCKFRCDGVKNVMTVNHELKQNEACRLLLAGLEKPWYQTAEGMALSAGGVVAAGFGVNAAIQNHRQNRAPSPARP